MLPGQQELDVYRSGHDSLPQRISAAEKAAHDPIYRKAW